MGLTQIHKQEFNMKLIYTTKQKRRFVQIKHKWCNKLNRDNLKFKLYTSYNLYEEAPLPSLYNTFSRESQNWDFYYLETLIIYIFS
jgi:hypothetical protein